MKYLSIVLYVLMMSLGLVTASHAGKGYVGYVTGSDGKLARDNYGKCIKTGSWSKKHEIPECGGKIPDADGDGVADDKDKCPGTPKGVKVDSKGCPMDADGDGVTDDKDKCPGTPAGVSVDGSGCPMDADGDGVADYMDKCPGTPPGAAVDANGCPKDSDGDSIPDYLDKCPGTAAGTRVDNKGCELQVRIELQGVNFSTNSANLTADSSYVLDDMAITLKRYPDLKVEVAGHTDSRGSAAYNKGLSQRRAESVRQYLIGKGVKAGSLTSKGYGESSPVADNNTKAGRAANRRVELNLK